MPQPVTTEEQLRVWAESCPLVGCVPFDRLPAATAAKLHGLEINPSYEAICRNVGIFIRQNESSR